MASPGEPIHAHTARQRTAWLAPKVVAVLARVRPRVGRVDVLRTSARRMDMRARDERWLFEGTRAEGVSAWSGRSHPFQYRRSVPGTSRRPAIKWCRRRPRSAARTGLRGRRESSARRTAASPARGHRAEGPSTSAASRSDRPAGASAWTPTGWAPSPPCPPMLSPPAHCRRRRPCSRHRRQRRDSPAAPRGSPPAPCGSSHPPAPLRYLRWGRRHLAPGAQ